MKRRNFLKSSMLGSAGTLVAPYIVPASVIGKNGPNSKIQIGQIGTGRIARGHDIPETIKHDIARFTAVSDVDRHRMADGKKLIEDYYKKKKDRKSVV